MITSVMPGLDPGSHGVGRVPVQRIWHRPAPMTGRNHPTNAVDTRVKPGHDGVVVGSLGISE